MPNQFRTTGTQAGDIAAGYITGGVYNPNPTVSPNNQNPASLGGTMVNPPSTTPPTSTSPFVLSQVMLALGEKVRSNNAMMTQRNLLLKHLYDQPLTEQEKAQLNPAFLNAINSNDRNLVDMNLRLIGDELRGRTNTLDSSIKYLTDAYQTEITNAENKKKDMQSALKDYATITGDTDMFKNWMTQTYGNYFEELGIDINSFMDDTLGSAETAAQRNSNPLNMKVGGLTQKYIDSGLATIGSKAVDGGNFLKFTSPEAGFQAAKELLKNPFYSNLTLDKAMRQWSGGGYGAEVAPGLDPVGKIKDFRPEQIEQLVQDMAKREGYYDQTGAKDDYLYGDFTKGLSQEGSVAFNQMPEKDKLNVMQLINGDALVSDIAKGIGGAKYAQTLLGLAKKVDPTFSENTNKIRYAFNQKWNSTESVVGKMRNAINTSLGHLAELANVSKELDPTTIQKMNSVKNVLSKEFGDPAVTNFRIIINALAGETAMVYKGTGAAPTEEESKRWLEAIADSFSRNQFKGAFNTVASLLSSKITATRYQYKLTMGKEYPNTVIDPDKRQQLIEAGVDPESIIQENTGEGDNGNTTGNIQDEYAVIMPYYSNQQFNIPGHPELKTREDVINFLKQRGYTQADLDANPFYQTFQ